MQPHSHRKWKQLWSLICHATATLSLSLCLLHANPAAAASGNVTYTYDALGRVTTASYDTNVIVIYTYDANGNRTQQVINVNSGTLCWTTIGAGCTTNIWGAGLWNP